MKTKKFKSGNCKFKITSDLLSSHLGDYYYAIIQFETEKPYKDKIFIGSEMWENKLNITNIKLG